MYDVLTPIELFVQPFPPSAIRILQQFEQSTHELVLLALVAPEPSLLRTLVVVMEVDLLLVGDVPELGDEPLTSLVLAVSQRALTVEEQPVTATRTLLGSLNINHD
jgi:hypothetical protein